VKNPPLTPTELELVRSVFRLHPEVQTATLFGSRAKGTHSPRSDVDLAITGSVSALRAETIASELEELPLPYRFDVQALDQIRFKPLLEHIQRVGLQIYPAA
jgi:predicted nucleotidyltransferase